VGTGGESLGKVESKAAMVGRSAGGTERDGRSRKGTHLQASMRYRSFNKKYNMIFQSDFLPAVSVFYNCGLTPQINKIAEKINLAFRNFYHEFKRRRLPTHYAHIVHLLVIPFGN
jgi:hypothetical protein